MTDVMWAEENDREIFKASTLARKTFRFFWREVAWERRRIVPAYDLVVLKFAFIGPAKGGGQAVEFMWVDEVGFDGRFVEGRLINAPLQLKGLRKGARVSLEFDQLADWMLARDGRPEGGFTVRVLRKHLTAKERAAHDSGWGLSFGGRLDPRRFSCATPHPMEANAAKAFEAQLRAGTLKPNAKGKDGWAPLHHFALAGAKRVVQVLLEHGADPFAETPEGLRPADLSDALSWKDVSRLLYRAERDA